MLSKIIIFLGFLALANAADNSTDVCTWCIENGIKLWSYYGTEEEIGKQTNDLINVACPQMEDEDDCVQKVTDWWPGMNAIYFESQGVVSGICLGMDACGDGEPEGWDPVVPQDCTECVNFIDAVSIHMSSDRANGFTTNLFKNGFCPYLPIEDVIPICREWVVDFVPIGFKVLANHVKHHDEETCGNVFSLCP